MDDFIMYLSRVDRASLYTRLKHMGLDTPGFIPSFTTPLVQEGSILARLLLSPSQEKLNDSASSDQQGRPNVGITYGGTTIVLGCGPGM